MLPTLQWYIFREMGKTFLLAAVGLTVVLGLGGGAMKLIEVEQLPSSQLFRLMFIVLPVAGTLTLPVAALYAATATYGRLSADNEFLACRASGINVLRLFLAPAVISLLSAACTFYFTSFMIPGLVRDLNTFARSGMRQLVKQQVRSPGRLPLPGRMGRIYADGASPSSQDQDAVVLRGTAYLEFGKQGWRKIGTAERIVLRFSSEDSQATPTLSGDLYNATYYDHHRGRWASVEHVKLRPNQIPLRIRPKVKWLNLGELLGYRLSPEGWPKVSSTLGQVRDEIARGSYYAEVLADYERDHEVVLGDERGTVTLRARDGVRDTLRDGRLTFVDVTVADARGTPVRIIGGDQVVLFVDRSETDDLPQAVLQVSGNVTVREEGVSTEPIRKGRERLEGMVIPEHILSEVSRITDAELLDDAQWMVRTADPTLLPTARELRVEAVNSRDRFLRKVTSELHSRLAFSVSAFVLVLLGAALGMMFRGSQVMVAFGISFVPSLFVTVMNIMGRQLAEKPGSTALGVWVIWGAIVAVGVLDAWALSRVVRR